MEPDVVTDEEFGNKVLKVEVDASTLSTGVYDVKAMWEKNDGRNIMKSARTGVFAITDNSEEVGEIKSEVIRIASYVESIGRDGLSAYEIAVIRGLNNGLSENDWVGNEAGRIVAEQERESAETTRKENETARENAESSRQSRFNTFMTESSDAFSDAQTNRDTAFTQAQGDRETAFTDRIADFEARFNEAEAARDNGEGRRNQSYAEAENKRDADYATAEANRDKKYGQAEATRNSTIDSKLSDIEIRFKYAEDARKTIFNNNEDSRQTNEQYRIQAEGKREKDFQDNEQRREQTFQDNEVTRQINEIKREVQESIRQQAEQIRIDTFDENERGRISAENERKQNETQREANETIRQESYLDKLPVSAVVQETGDGENVVMSQKAVSEKLTELDSKANFSNSTVISGVIKTSHNKVGEANVFVKAGSKLKITYNFSSLAGLGWRLYENITGNSSLTGGDATDLNGTKIVTTTQDVTKFLLYTTSDIEGECVLYIENTFEERIANTEEKVANTEEKLANHPVYSTAIHMAGSYGHSWRAVAKASTFINKGRTLKISYNFSSSVLGDNGWRLYANEPGNIFAQGGVKELKGEKQVKVDEDIHELFLYVKTPIENEEGTFEMYLSEFDDRIISLQTNNEKHNSEIREINSNLYGGETKISFAQHITSSRKKIGELQVRIEEGEEFTVKAERNYVSLTDGRLYDENFKSLSYLYEGMTETVKAPNPINKLLFYDDSETVGEMVVTIGRNRKYATYNEFKDVDDSVDNMIDGLYGDEQTLKFNQPISSGRTYIGSFDVNIKEGDKFTLEVQRDYESLTGGRIYQNEAPDLLSGLTDKERSYVAKKDINKFIIYDDSNTEGVMTLTYKKESKFALKEEVEDKRTPYKGLYGTVIGDSHAIRRASWVPQVYSRLGVNYDENVASFIVGEGNSCGEGYEDCVDPVFAQAKRAVESYNKGNKIDFILLDNVHYVYESDVMPVIPFKMNQIVDLGKMEGSSSQEKTWFNNNFTSLVAKAEQKLGTTLKSTWTRKKYDLTFSGTPVAGTSFSIIIDGKTYDTPINEGDTLTTFAKRVATWVFGEEWTSTSKNNVVTITYNGNGTAPTLIISYNANGSGITMTSTEGEVESSVYRYYQRKDLVDWNNVSAWGVVSSWFAGGLKGAVEYLLENIPTVKIVIISLPYYPIEKNDFLTELGQDQEAFLSSSTYTSNRKRVTLMKNIAEYYNLPFVDFEKDAYISLSNYFNYFPERDVHPYKIGYERLADCICAKLGF